MSQHGLLGRLPSLHLIGRSNCIDLEEPPDIGSDLEDLSKNYLRITDEEELEQPRATVFNVEQASTISTALTKGFQIINPGNYYCKRFPAQCASFTHCQKGAILARKNRELDRLLATQARLELEKDVLSRIVSADTFVQELRQTAADEFQTWYSIGHDSLSGPVVTKLENLCAFCDELRIQMNQWSSIMQFVHTNPHLRKMLSELLPGMDSVKIRLNELNMSAICWLDGLIHIGFKVLCHCDLDRIGHESLVNIARGLEEFNLIAGSVRMTSSAELSACFSGDASLVPNHMPSSCQTIPLEGMIRSMAYERGKYAAMSTKDFFTGNKEFLNFVQNTRLPKYVWMSSQRDSAGNLRASHDVQINRHTDVSSRVSISLQLTESIKAPDLSSSVSPMIDFVRREHTFIGLFLQVVCHVTSLIKKQSDDKNDRRFPGAVTTRSSASKARMLGANTAAAANSAKVNAGYNSDFDSSDDIESSGDNLQAPLVRSDATRKSVSWSDSALALLIQQTMARYFFVLWNSFVDHFCDFVKATQWGGPKESKDRLGSLVLCPDIVILIVERMIRAASVGDSFPVGCRPKLTELSIRILSWTSFSAWDAAFSSALASSTVDKCQAVGGTDESYSTQTACQLLETLHPLHELLGVMKSSIVPNVVSPTEDENPGVSFTRIFHSLVSRLLVSEGICHSWSSTKLQQFSSSRSVANFLLVSRNDLQKFSSKSQEINSLCKQILDCYWSILPTEKAKYHRTAYSLSLRKQLETSIVSLEDLGAASISWYNLLCSTSAREYFDTEMPTGKGWKRKAGEIFPNQHSEYIEQAMDSLLEPVLSGSTKLQPAACLEALSAAITCVCNAWMETILEKKIRFSYQGACQLELDALYVRTWLSSYIQDTLTQSKILSLDVFKHLDCVIFLLKQQPGGRSCSRIRSGNGGNNKSASTVLSSYSDGTRSLNDCISTSSGDTHEKNSNGFGKETKSRFGRSSKVASVSVDETDMEAFQMPQKEQWLALRVQGGSRNWPRLTFCFNSSSSSSSG